MKIQKYIMKEEREYINDMLKGLNSISEAMTEDLFKFEQSGGTLEEWRQKRFTPYIMGVHTPKDGEISNGELWKKVCYKIRLLADVILSGDLDDDVSGIIAETESRRNRNPGRPQDFDSVVTHSSYEILKDNPNYQHESGSRKGKPHERKIREEIINIHEKIKGYKPHEDTIKGHLRCKQMGE